MSQFQLTITLNFFSVQSFHVQNSQFSFTGVPKEGVALYLAGAA